MSKFSDLLKKAAPIIGGGLGFFFGGPHGAAIGASIGSGVSGAAAAKDAAKVQAQATDRASQMQQDVASQQLDLQRRMYEEGVARQQPFLEAGQGALNQLIPLSSQYTQFGMDQFQQDPGYQFRLEEGMKALDRQAAARGGLISGSALKAAQRFGQGLASQEYQNAFNRYQAERAAQLQPLQSLAGVGQTTAQQIGAAGQQYGQAGSNVLGQMASNVGNLMTAGAQARASGYVGGANALTGAFGTGLNFYQNQQFVNELAKLNAAQARTVNPSPIGLPMPSAGGFAIFD
jgi:hypothetical protein